MAHLVRISTLAVVVTLAVAGQAFAHAHLKTSVPADKASVASPNQLDLTFSEGLNLKFSGIKVTGPNKTDVKLGNGMLMDDNKTLMVPVSDKLEPGTYTVEWHVLSNDGHKTNGRYTFAVKSN